MLPRCALQLLLSKPMDLKSAMQAISNGGSQEMAKLLLKAMKEQQIKEHRPERACMGAHMIDAVCCAWVLPVGCTC